MRYGAPIAVAVLFSVARAGEDPEVLLDRVREHISEHLAHLPNYTCHESIDRMARTASGRWQYIDSVDLEVAFVGDEELFSKPGENKFGEKPIEQMVSSGTIGNSAFGSHADVILSRNSLAEFRYAGSGKKDGHETYRFDLRVPLEKSRFRVRHMGAEGMAGYEGSIWVDAQTLDLVRVDFHVNRIPSNVGVKLIEESLHYRKLTIGSTEFDLPEKSELAATDDLGNYSLNTIKLGQCREFSTDSVVKYLSPSQGTASRDAKEH